MLVGEWLQPLEDEGRGVGVVAIPLGARTKRPLVVAVHGAGSLPEWMCSAARAGLGSHPFVVCPHSLANAGTLASWASPEELATAVERAVRAAVARFPEYVDTTEAMYFGHSQGAMIAPTALAKTGLHFRYALFFEGLPPDAPTAKALLLRAHVERFLLVSGQGGWSQGHERLAKSFRGTSMASKHVHGNFGHFFNEEVFAAMRRELPWLVEGAPAWQTEESSPAAVTNAGAAR
jgi:predicted esterase